MSQNLFQILIHFDKYLSLIIQDWGRWTYLFLFLIVFCETGLVITPFLPGDSLLFATGAISAMHLINVNYLFIIFSLAAILGDTINYSIGHYVGPKIFYQEKNHFFKKEYLDRAHRFYEKHGGKTIIFARFIPIIRTFAPFVAGISKMSYGKFISYNICGGLTWVAIFLFGGYFFGNIPIIQANFSTVIFLIILISILPGIMGFCKKLFRR